MGSQKIQGKLWGQQSKDWAAIQEKTGIAGYNYVLNLLQLKPADLLLDVGCGSGYFAQLASEEGANITGIDASEKLLIEAKERTQAINFLMGEMEELPFANESFNIVCGFNSFQYAANTIKVLTEARRVLQEKGKLIVMVWGNKADCEASTYLKAVGSLLPPPPLGSPGPFALSENNLLEELLVKVGFKTLKSEDVDSIWDYPNLETALKGLMSAGPVARAIEHSGFDKAKETILLAIQPYIKSNGHVVYHNKYRIVMAEK